MTAAPVSLVTAAGSRPRNAPPPNHHGSVPPSTTARRRRLPSTKDEYVCLYFRSNRELTRDQLRVEIDGYGVPVLLLAAIGNGEWQANMTLPPGLDPGEHSIRLRTVDSHFSRPFPIEVSNRQGAVPPLKALPDPSLATGPAPQWIAAENCADRTPVFRGYKAEYLCCRFLTDEPELRKEDVLVELDGAAQEILVLSHLGHREWQTNSRCRPGSRPDPTPSASARPAARTPSSAISGSNRIWTRIRPTSRCECGRPVYPRSPPVASLERLAERHRRVGAELPEVVVGAFDHGVDFGDDAARPVASTSHSTGSQTSSLMRCCRNRISAPWRSFNRNSPKVNLSIVSISAFTQP